MRAGRTAAVAVVLLAGWAISNAAQQPDTAPIRLQLRVFDGTEELTQDSRILLYRRGDRQKELPVQRVENGVEAMVPPGFYDVQVVRMQDGQVLGIKWAEQILVQRYPDEHGRHLQVVNLKPDFGALQVRPAPDALNASRGWSAVVFAAGDTTRELAKARPIGNDLLVLVPAGRYDVRVTAADKSVTWIRDVEVPAERTRLKTWSPGANP